ncbi:alanine or glycine:cation symporter, AGCS family [Oscillibacter sp. PC13]|uniref:alanine/glycine:cation symporter family protein n=1 Tax=Oscillibacter sp. PC13 TaxID=1855299 RepID=UPI0008DFA6C0|nr:sodium:alanine symporter family protein [Oscillibacter sp. PC13]SFP02215.1 alanine or glycine:cation symporter, AGCS family [Oscillibacter sp. PC13]
MGNLIAIGDKLVAFSGWLWGVPIIIVLLVTSVFMSVRLGFFQFRHFGYILKSTLFGAFGKKSAAQKGEGTLTAFQALTSAVACTVGAGNITGVPMAIMMGGPGAVFWMWVIALLAMALKYSEILLAVKYRRKSETGEWEGGPARYMTEGLHMKWLAVIFAIGLMIEVAISSMTQANALAGSAQTSLGIPPIATGIVIMILTALVLIGGIKSLGKFTEKMVPVMAGIYVVAALIIVILNIAQVPAMLALIFKSAFTPSAAIGGFAGSTVAMAVRWGFARGVYSNEAGLGTAPIAHASATTDHPARQGLWGITEIFLDTIVICTCTAFVVLSTGAWEDPAAAFMEGAGLATFAFSSAFGKMGGYLITLSLILFVFSTLIVLIWYGEKQAEFLFNSNKAAIAYRIICILLIPLGSVGTATYLWNFLDLSLAVILFPNLIAIILLHKEIVQTTKEFFETPGKFFLKDKEEKLGEQTAKR